ncbi:unnamed protein product [Rotaria sp. Silwood2]|nr:unnamed protein product [Rotaria sp. Silwood2]CAF2616521.1 unnamed protein product [Rotaria sp. Silwood2]CAF3010104.1 unnamed protein product [Rotaria sp. Silwood2]CAF3898541.1 unnamed protein product [Rotaria sp. Silwood2]CAF4041347.1 unnamed protein product [Rotaria sp. Silwood2]
MEETSDEKQLASQFYFACRNADFDLAIHLLNQHRLEDIDRMEPNGSTALHAACYYEHFNIVKILLDRGFTRRVINKFDKTPIDEAYTEELRHLFLRPKSSNRFGGDTPYERETSIWIPVDGNEKIIIQDPITDLYKGNRLEYGIFQADNIIKQLDGMPKLDVIQRFFRRAVQEKDCTRLIQAYTAETDFYNHVNNYLLSRQQENNLSQFVQTIYFNDQLHKKYFYEGTCYRSIMIDSEDQLNLFKKGAKILNRTFISTTRDRQIAEEYILDRNNENKYIVMMIFKLRHCYTALNIQNISEFSHEEEVLIMCDTIFKVEKITRPNNFYIEIELRYSKSNQRR